MMRRPNAVQAGEQEEKRQASNTQESSKREHKRGLYQSQAQTVPQICNGKEHIALLQCGTHRLGHRKAGADVLIEKWLKPLPLLLRVAELL